MPNCPSCRNEVGADQRFCGDCGAPLHDSLGPTETDVGQPRHAPAAASVAESAQPRFLPGATLTARYRIVGLLGRGGMGEVYRADDLKLGQPVALKFLPRELERDALRLERLLNEVKLARRVSHPNVCRVHDVSEVDGRHFLSMEYVDGEDLETLLRRIGRLPPDKATQVARQICAGLAAAHDQGILHRDLKPANVMIDGRGQAKITDFGLAGLTDTLDGADTPRAGTPAYMAPEQLTGETLSIHSDVYALGLVLYELFTGRSAFAAGSVAEMVRLRAQSTPTRPTELVEGIDPAVERVILRCLAARPADRPSSALAVAAALPGGDPLAAALAAGETPSPELVAAAGSVEALQPIVALGLAVLALGAFCIGAWLNGRNAVRAYLPLDKPPAVMADRAREIVARLGYTEPVYRDPADTAFGYDVWQPVLEERAAADRSARRWEVLRAGDSGVLSFWYRQSPTTMIPTPSEWGTFSGGRVERWNPFPAVTGQILVSLGPAGRLQFFVHTPRRYTTATPPTAEPDWSVAFELAGLDIGRFRAVEPRYQRFIELDRRAAWTGELPGRPGQPVRIEAGTHDGRLTFWGILEPRELETLAAEPGNYEGPSGNEVAFLVLVTTSLITGVLLARRNVRGGRADRRGAARLALFMLLVGLAAELLRSHALLTLRGAYQIYPITGTALFIAGAMMTLYLALEPYARRIWPSMLVAWSRLVREPTRAWRDPLIGRSVLWGALAGAAISLLGPLRYLARSLVVGAPDHPSTGNWAILLGQRQALAEIAETLSSALTKALLLTLILVVARLLLRRPWLAASLTGALWIALGGAIQPGATLTLVQILFGALAATLLLAVLQRQGLVALIACILVHDLGALAATADWRAWHAQPALLVVAVVAGLVGWGYAAAARQPTRATVAQPAR